MKSAFRPLAASLVLTVFAAITVTACSGAAPDESTQGDDAPQTEHRVTLDAATIAALPAGQSYVVDLGRADTTYVFDYAGAPIDFSRVTIRAASGRTLPMTTWLARSATDGLDIVAQNPDHFELRPAQSDDPTPEAVDPTNPDCVTICGWVCKAEHGPCVWKCITNC
jgi:hypothetical protein